MAVVVEQCYGIQVGRLSNAINPVGDDLEIILGLFSTTARRPSLADPIVEATHDLVADKTLLVAFSSDKGIKQKRHESHYRERIAATLSAIGVPEIYHSEALDTLFEEIEAAVSPEPPIFLCICQVQLRTDGETSNYSRTDRSAIEGLERVRLDRAIMEETQSCPICWVDYVDQDVVDQLMLTRMPCSHYFHGDCIRHWLQLNHLCPMCRYSMPVEQHEGASYSSP